MKRLLGGFPGAVFGVRERIQAVASQSERTIMLGTILIASACSAVWDFVLAQYYSVDVFSSLSFPGKDCWPEWAMKVGQHCFNDYAAISFIVALPDPWIPFKWADPPTAYPAAGLVPNYIFAAPAAWLHAPWLGLIAYMIALTIAVLSPAIWAARGARGLERVVLFVTLGAAAIPVWTVIDRANSTGFVAPIALVFLIALRRCQWGLVVIMVILAALLKPQFAVLAVVLFAARQWRLGGIALGGVVISNLTAYLLWWRNFPHTIVQTIHNTFKYSSSFEALVGPFNVSFGKGIFFIPDEMIRYKLGYVPEGFLNGPRSLTGSVVLIVVVVCTLALGRRIPPVMAGVLLLPTVVLFPPLAYRYYLVFALPIAALVARDPDGLSESGIFDRLALLGDRRRAVGVCVSLAAALTIAQTVLPGKPVQFISDTPINNCTAVLTPILWLVACAAILISYSRKPARYATTGAVTISRSQESAETPAS